MSAPPAKFLALIAGDDDFAVKQRARQIFDLWCGELGGMDHEIIEASVNNAGEAMTVLAKLREAVNTLPFFGGGKVVWFRNCNFLGEERTASTSAVTEILASFAEEIKSHQFESVRLLISAGKIDKRKVFYKAIEKHGGVELFSAWSINDRDWVERAETMALKSFKQRNKIITEDALAELLNRVGPNPRQLEGELDKLSLFVGEKAEVTATDVQAICSRNKIARAFALGDALGDRDLPRLLKRLDEELWETKHEKDKSEIGLLYGLVSKIRALLFLKEMTREGWIKETRDYNAFKLQLDRVPTNNLPKDRRFNPLALNPYVLYKALPQARKYTTSELVEAMNVLLHSNRRLVSSGLDETLVLQQAVVQIVTSQASR